MVSLPSSPRVILGSCPSLAPTASTAVLMSASGWKVAAFSATRCRPFPPPSPPPCLMSLASSGDRHWPPPFLSPASPRPSSAAAATTSGPCWTTTSERTRSWRPQAASWPSLSMASRLTSSPTCSTTSTVTTRRCGARAGCVHWARGCDHRDRCAAGSLRGFKGVPVSCSALWGWSALRLERKHGTRLDFSFRQRGPWLVPEQERVARATS